MINLHPSIVSHIFIRKVLISYPGVLGYFGREGWSGKLTSWIISKNSPAAHRQISTNYNVLNVCTVLVFLSFLLDLELFKDKDCCSSQYLAYNRAQYILSKQILVNSVSNHTYTHKKDTSRITNLGYSCILYLAPKRNLTSNFLETNKKYI